MVLLGDNHRPSDSHGAHEKVTSVVIDIGSWNSPDYSARQWAGMLKNFYFQRWHLWIRQQQSILAGREGGKINWFTWARKWTRQYFRASGEIDGINAGAKRMVRLGNSHPREACPDLLPRPLLICPPRLLRSRHSGRIVLLQPCLWL